MNHTIAQHMPPVLAQDGKVAPPDRNRHRASEGAPVGAAVPARIDLSCDIASASRSVMVFALNLQLELANRSDRAMLGVSVFARLVSAENGDIGYAELTAGVPLVHVNRIGPQQNQRIGATLQLPLRDVRVMRQTGRQGGRPVFVPVLLVALQTTDKATRVTRFVVGSPSEVTRGRLHPLPLDGPPGSVRGLRAQRVSEQPAIGEAVAHEPVEL